METLQGSHPMSNHASTSASPQVVLPSPPAEEAEDAPQKGLNLRPLLRIAQRNALLITGITALITGAAYWFTLHSDPTYEGHFRFLVEPVTPEGTLSDPTAVARGEERPAQEALDYATQLEILKSSQLLSDVVAQVKTRYPDFNEGALRSGLTVQQCCTASGAPGSTAQATKLVEVLYQGSDPDQVQFVLQVAADRFLQYSLEDRKSTISEGVRFIDSQLPDLEQRVRSLQAQIEQLQQQYLLTNPEDQGAQLSTQLLDTTNQRLEAQRLLREQQVLFQNLQQQLGLPPDQAIAASTLSEDPGYQDLLRQREQIENQLALDSARFSPASPTVQSLQRRLNQLSQLQQQRAAQVLGSDLAPLALNPRVLAFQNSIRTDLAQQLVDAANQVQVLQARSQNLQQAQSLFNQQAQQFPAVARQFNELQRQLQLATQTLDQLLSQRETLKVEAAQSEFPWQLVSQPQIPTDADGNPLPAEDDLLRNLVFASALGLSLAFASAFSIERFRDVFFSVDDLHDATQLPILSVIPFNPSIRLNPSPLAASDDTLIPFLDAFKALFTQLLFLYGDVHLRAITISSALPHEGKSTAALALALTAAASHRRVLLVDANLSNPKLHSLLGLPNHLGLADILLRDTPLSDAIIPSNASDFLSLLPAGLMPPQASGLLNSPRLLPLLASLRSSFDLIIFDTPDLSHHPDAFFLASLSDGVISTTIPRSSSRSATLASLNQLSSFHIHSLGLLPSLFN